MFAHLHHRINSVVSWVKNLFSPLQIAGLIFFTRARITAISLWNADEFQLNNQVKINGLPNGEIPNFLGANTTTERVTLDSTITLDCTVGWRVDCLAYSNGDWDNDEAGSNGFGFLGNISTGIFKKNKFNIIQFHDGTVNFVDVSLSTALMPYTLYNFSFRCDGVNIYVYINNGLDGSSSVGSIGDIIFDYISFARSRLAEGLNYDVYLNSTSNDTNWTNHWLGINGDWTDKVDTVTNPANNGTAGPDLKYIKNSIRNAKAKTGAYLKCIAANSDYVDIPEQTLSGDFTFSFLLKNDGTAENFLGDSNAAQSRIRIIDSTTLRVLIGGSIYDYTTIDNTDFIYCALIRSGSDLSLYINGSLVETKNSVDTSDFIFNAIGQGAGVFGDILVGDFALFKSTLPPSQVLALYNNPQRFAELCREYNAVLAYDFAIGNGFDGWTVLDLSGNGNNGTLVSSASANMIYNDAPVSSQQVLKSRNLYYYLDGTSQYYSFASPLISDVHNFEAEFDFYFNSFGSDNILISEASTSSNTPLLYFGVTNTGNIIFFLRSNSAVVVATITTIESINENSLNTVSVTNNNGSVLITVNGVEESFSYTPTGLFTFNTSSIGAVDRATDILFYNGVISKAIVAGATVDLLNSTVVGSPKSIFAPESSTLGIDIYGNTITNRWKAGLLNFTGLDKVDNPHGGVEIGDQVSTLDSGKVIFGTLKCVDNGAIVNLFDNTDGLGGDGRIVEQTATRYLKYYNETGGTQLSLTSTTQMTAGSTYKYMIFHDGTTAEIWLEEINTDFTTADASGTVGAMGLGTGVPTLSGNSLQVASKFYENELTLAETNNLGKYDKSKIQ